MLPVSDQFGPSALSDSYFAALLAGSRITASLVVDSEGDYQDEQGGSKLLGGETDLLWLRALRRNAALVLTSGKTYRAEQYRMPKSAHLAVLSRSRLSPPEGLDNQARFIELGEVPSIPRAVQALVSDFKRVHLELGPSTLIPTCKELGLGIWISSLEESGVLAFCHHHELAVLHEVKVNDLVIAYCR